MPTKGSDTEKKKSAKAKKAKPAASKTSAKSRSSATKSRKAATKKSGTSKSRTSTARSSAARTANKLPKWWSSLERASIGMESVLNELAQGSINSAERAYAGGYEPDAETGDFSLNESLPEVDGLRQGSSHDEDKERRIRSIEEELERLALDEDGDEESQEGSVSRADELEAAVFEREAREESAPESESDADFDTDVYAALESERDPEPEPDPDLEPEPEPDPDLETEPEPEMDPELYSGLEPDPEPEHDSEAEHDPEAEMDSEPEHAVEPFRRFEASSPSPAAEPRNPFAPEENLEPEKEVAEPSTSSGRRLGDGASIGEAIVLMRDEEQSSEEEEEPSTDDEEVPTTPSARRIDLSENEVQYRTLDLLQEDVHRLFLLGDVMGALVSLERVVLVAGDRPHVRGFLARNSDKLLHLYEQVFGGFERVLVLSGDEETLGPDIIGPVLLPNVRDMVDGVRTMRQIMAESDASEVEVATALHHMLRTRRVMFS